MMPSELCRESLALLSEQGDKRAIASVVNSLGKIAHEQGDYASAHALYEESLSTRRELGDKKGIADSLNNIADIAQEQHAKSRARSLHIESLLMRQQLGDKRGLAQSLLGLARAEAEHDFSASREVSGPPLVVDYPEVEKHHSECVRRAATLLGAAGALLEAMSSVPRSMERKVYEKAATIARDVLGEVAFEKAMQKGRAMTAEEAVHYATSPLDDV